ncbi:MAG: Transport protein [Mycobacterium sp.]|nr:Transport protein [Mycobacterium sp.]
MTSHDNEPTTDTIPTSGPSVNPTRHRLPRLIRTLALPVILGWILIIVLGNTVVPQLEEVGKMRSVSMSPNDAPSVISMQHIGTTFKEFKSNSSVMIVLEGKDKLGDEAHKFYDELVKKLEADTKHVEHVQDFWSDPLTAAGSQSSDGKAMYFQVYLSGNQGEALANESVEAVQHLVDGQKAPPGLAAYVTGPAALAADQTIAGDRSLQLIEMVTFTVIIVMLLLVYRSIVTVLIVLVMVVLELAAARGIVAFLGYHNIIGLSTFATNLLVTLAIAAATDYAIFLIGRYQEARSLGESKEDAYYTMFNGTAHVVLGSGLTIAGATYCLSFTRLPYFQTLGIPLAIGMIIVVLCALSLGPAVVTIGSRFGLLEPKRALRTRGWRKIGAAVVRWPGPILVGTIALALVGLLTLPGYRTNYNDRNYLPADLPANEGYAAADRHFSQARMNPELMMIESDHDLRNSADFLVIDKIAKAIFKTPGIGRVQAITRPLGTPIEHTSIPFQISMQGTTQQMNLKYQQDSFASMLKQADEMQGMIENLEHMLVLMKQLNDVTHDLTLKTKDMVATTNELRDNIANFDDFFRPIRAYLYWEPHCYDIPLCWATRSVFDTLDGIDALSDQLGGLVTNLDALDKLMPQLMESMPPMLATMKSMNTMMLTM